MRGVNLVTGGCGQPMWFLGLSQERDVHILSIIFGITLQRQPLSQPPQEEPAGTQHSMLQFQHQMTLRGPVSAAILVLSDHLYFLKTKAHVRPLFHVELPQ